MDALERYLNCVTRWLYGHKGRAVRAELEGNLRELALEYQLQGLEPQTALEQALHDFGDPRRLERELMEVHTMPAIHKFSLVTLSLGALVIAAVSSAAPLGVSPNAPLPDCASVNPDAVVNAAFNCATPGAWIALRDLDAQLASSSGATARTGNTLTLRFAGDSKTIMVSLKNPEPFIANPGGMPEYTYHQYRSFTRLEQTFVNLQLIVSSVVSQSALPVQLEGWRNPTLNVGATRLELGKPDAPFVARDLYEIGFASAVRAALRDRAADPRDIASFDNTPGKIASFTYDLHRIALPDGVYAVLTQDAKGKLVYTIAPSQNGVVEVFLPAERINFVADLNAVSDSNAPLEARAVALRLTGALNAQTFEIVKPDMISSERIAR
jgi:hypothetical protein